VRKLGQQGQHFLKKESGEQGTFSDKTDFHLFFQHLKIKRKEKSKLAFLFAFLG
jgi:hypothetical protein